jgi:hypothetical protein
VALRSEGFRHGLFVLGFALFACAWSCASQARAQQVALDASACSELPESELRALLTLELHTRLLDPHDSEPPDSEHVDVRCAGDAAELARMSTGAKRTLSFAGVAPPLRARVLALAIAELLRPDDKPAGPEAAPQAKAPEELAEARAAKPDEPRYHLWAGVNGGALPLLSLGGALLLRVSIMRLFAWSSSFSFSQGRTGIDLGELRVRDLSLRTGPALSFVLAPVTLLMGAGVRVSLLRLAGEPHDKRAAQARSFDSWLFVPSLFLGAAVTLARGAFLALDLDFGHALRRVRADEEGAGAHTLSAWRASAVLGAGFQW